MTSDTYNKQISELSPVINKLKLENQKCLDAVRNSDSVSIFSAEFLFKSKNDELIKYLKKMYDVTSGFIDSCEIKEQDYTIKYLAAMDELKNLKSKIGHHINKR